jgi:hypothetical protein
MLALNQDVANESLKKGYSRQQATENKQENWALGRLDYPESKTGLAVDNAIPHTRNPNSQLLMATIAIRRIFGLFALADGNRLCFAEFKF